MTNYSLPHPDEWTFTVPELPDAPRPLEHGYESIDWGSCGLAQMFGVPGTARRVYTEQLPR